MADGRDDLMRALSVSAVLFVIAAFSVHAASGPSPTDFRGFQWGTAPTKTMQKVGGPHGPERLSVWKNPNKNLKLYFELPIVEEGYLFQNGRLFGGELFIDGADNFAKLKAALIKQFGAPDFGNEDSQVLRWKWQNPEVEMLVSYAPNFARTTVHVERKGIPPLLKKNDSPLSIAPKP